MFRWIGMNQENEILHGDNQSAIFLTKNPAYHSRTKHIDIKVPFHSISDRNCSTRTWEDWWSKDSSRYVDKTSTYWETEVVCSFNRSSTAIGLWPWRLVRRVVEYSYVVNWEPLSKWEIVILVEPGNTWLGLDPTRFAWRSVGKYYETFWKI